MNGVWYTNDKKPGVRVRNRQVGIGVAGATKEAGAAGE